MADRSDSRSYDWDTHFGVQADLRALDDFHLQMSGKRPLQPGIVKKHIFPEFNAAVSRGPVDMNQYLMLLSGVTRNLMENVENFAAMSGARAGAIVGYLEELTNLFPEERWRPFLSYEIYNKGKMLDEIGESLEAIRPIYLTHGGRQYYTYPSWQNVTRDMEYAEGELKNIQGRSSIPDGPPLDEADLESRSLRLADMQEHIAGKTLEYAQLQTLIVRDSLRLATTMNILPSPVKTPFQMRIAVCAEMASSLMVTADFALDEAANLRNSSHRSRDLLRPVF